MKVKIVDVMEWFETLKARCVNLANDSDHSMNFSNEIKVKKGITRQGIVDIYEVAYVELSESYAGLEDTWKEQTSKIDHHNREVKQLSEYAGTLEEQVTILKRRVNGLLEVIEKDIPEPIYRPMTF